VVEVEVVLLLQDVLYQEDQVVLVVVQRILHLMAQL
jgi:hypothetical protein